MLKRLGDTPYPFMSHHIASLDKFVNAIEIYLPRSTNGTKPIACKPFIDLSFPPGKLLMTRGGDRNGCLYNEVLAFLGQPGSWMYYIPSIACDAPEKSVKAQHIPHLFSVSISRCFPLLCFPDDIMPSSTLVLSLLFLDVLRQIRH